MATNAQNAVVTFGGQTLSEVSQYDVRFTPWSAGRRNGYYGTVEIQAFAPLPNANLYNIRRLEISHSGAITFRAACYLSDYRMTAQRNDVIRYVMVFTIYWPA